ncbi:MAG TPA: class I SAM-dependent methyltransferase [Methanomassiliicoccales archaeon]|nr:class I SAM-dependent methyltransferase [Methanomassiliicoccales archaeon]
MHQRPTQFPASESHRLLNEERRRRQPVEVIIDRIRPRKDEVIADLGAGVGYLSIPLADEGAEVIALDLQQEMLDRIRERDNGLGRIRLVRATLPEIPLPDASLDRVVMVNVFHEVEDKAGLTREISRVLRPKGRVSLVDWQARGTEGGPPLHERVPAEKAPSYFPGFVLDKRYDDPYHYHLELRRE